ncbi:hypothetical protein [Cryobacterium shii]|nr:hypothetical protein [Cryobacterium shii]
MGHDHAHTSQTNRARLSLAIGIVATVLVVEIIGARKMSTYVSQFP